MLFTGFNWYTVRNYSFIADFGIEFRVTKSLVEEEHLEAST
jgi:hypothetical protein